MEEKEHIELLKWLIERSDKMRLSYANRATLILSADAFILAAIVFLIDKNLGQLNSVWKILIIISSMVSLVFMLVSFIYAFNACIARKRSRETTEFKGSNRIFLNPGDTFEELENIDEFKTKFKTMSYQEFIENACAELWVELKLQDIRYRKLKKSVPFILFSFMALIVALFLMLFR